MNKKMIRDVQIILNEVNIMQTVDHPNIVRYYETYVGESCIFLVMRFVKSGMRLLDKVNA